ncbi:biotin--[acetyl-CoA-carboxylase] ligase [Clostridium paraputrificum]|uniref:biotin--[acetyl-CoA-carboxylase] ligase n=1 Tax=Clostridium paraputrificum TaxID=29363 RepID=UPI003D3411A9
MDIDLIKMLKESGDYISGEEISKSFGITRSSVWKHIKALKEQGYNIEGISRKGYKLISSPDLLLSTEISDKLSTYFIGHNIEYFSEVQSTNETAKNLAVDDFKDGTIIIAEEQKGGKGRLGRNWSSPKGGIWLSIILKPNIEPIHASKVTQIAAAALVNVLRSMHINALIKWPNDIYINSKKVSGILTEMKCDMDRINYLIVGVGINVNLDESDLNDEIKGIATSLKIEGSKYYNRVELLTLFLKEFEDLYMAFVNDNDLSKVLYTCRKHSMLLKKEAYHVTSRGTEAVTCLGINDEGELTIRDSNGIEKSVISGEITFRK